jgi:hypothetical protein
VSISAKARCQLAAAVMSQRLWRYTSNSGHVAELGRQGVDQEIIDRLLPIVDAQEGDLAEFGFGIDITTPLDAERHRLPGAAFFQITAAGKRLSTTPYVMAVACWRAERAAGAWHQFRSVVDVVGENWPRAQRP